MKLPVIKGKIGNWIYYTGVMTFQELAQNVKPSIGEIYHATVLDDLLQRELTENYTSIKQYILNDKERFFNAIILAIFDGDPQWLEVEFPENEREFTNVGFLQFTGDEAIFPVDGQHRVKGIIEAIEENKSLSQEQVPVIFIAHHQSVEGRKRTRKLFSTLNRRNKPVGQNENIAIDEDDICAIVTRELIQSFPLFLGDNIANTKSKSIPASNKTAFTSLITLYQVVEELVRWKYLQDGGKKTRFNNYKLFRPDDKTITSYIEFTRQIFQDFINETTVIREYLKHQQDGKSEKYRNSDGGNILFRPIVLTEYFFTVLSLVDKSGCSIKAAFRKLDLVEQNLNKYPWMNFIWDGNKMINRVSKATIQSLLLYMADSSLFGEKDYIVLVKNYSKALNISFERAVEILSLVKL